MAATLRAPATGCSVSVACRWPTSRRLRRGCSGNRARVHHLRATCEQQGEQQQQQQGSQQQGSPPPPPPFEPRRRGGGDFVALAIAEYDNYISQAKEVLATSEVRKKEADEQLADLVRQKDVPAWLIRWLGQARNVATEAVETTRERQAALVSKREGFVAGLRQLEAELAVEPPLSIPVESVAEFLALAGYNWATEDGQDSSAEGLQKLLRESLERSNSPSNVMWATLVTCTAIAYGLAWAGTWWGVDAYRMLHDFPQPSAATTWLAWTAPYVGGTLLAYPLAPSLFNKSIFRVIASDQQQFYRKVPVPSFVFAAGVVAFCQCLVYQGLWQDVFTGWLGGSRDALLLTDPAQLEDSVRASMGTLVGSPTLPAFLVAPGAALLVGLLEGGYFYTSLTAATLLNAMQMSTYKEGDSEVAVVAFDMQPSVLGAEELPLVAARVALSGCYLALEATLTGNLWLAAGTSMAGLVTAIALTRRDGGA